MRSETFPLPILLVLGIKTPFVAAFSHDLIESFDYELSENCFGDTPGKSVFHATVSFISMFPIILSLVW